MMIIHSFQDLSRLSINFGKGILASKHHQLSTSLKYHLWLPSTGGLCICLNMMMVEIQFRSNFPRRFWGFALPWKKSKGKTKVGILSWGNLLSFCTCWGRSGLKTNIHILKKAIDSVHVSFGKNRIMRFSLDKWFETTFLSTFDNWV